MNKKQNLEELVDLKVREHIGSLAQSVTWLTDRAIREDKAKEVAFSPPTVIFAAEDASHRYVSSADLYYDASTCTWYRYEDRVGWQPAKGPRVTFP